MLTTRIRPKIRVKPLATTKYSAASVVPLSVTTAKRRGSSIALTNSQTATSATSAVSTMRFAFQPPAASTTPGSASGMVLPGPSASIASRSGWESPGFSCAVRAMP